MRWAGHVARIVERKRAYRVLVEEPEGKDHFGEPGVSAWDLLSCILDLWDVGGIDWIQLAQDRGGWRALVNVLVNHWVS